MVSEKFVEIWLKDAVTSRGGECLKFVSPGRQGVTDRIVLMPGGKIWFVELKTSGGSLKPSQIRFQARVNELGFKVITLWSVEDVNQFLCNL